MFLILGLILWGMVAGALAWWILGRGRQVNWSQAFVAGIVGSFVGGLLLSLIAGDGLELRPSGMIGSVVGAIIVLALWGWLSGRSSASGSSSSSGKSAKKS